MKRTTWITLLALAGAILCGSNPAAAQTKTYRFRGLVNSVSGTGDLLGGSVAVGHPFVTTLSFGPTTPEPSSGLYGDESYFPRAPHRMTMEVGPHVVTSGRYYEISVSGGTGSSNSFDARFTDNFSTTTATFDFVTVSGAVYFSAPTDSILTDDSIPTVAKLSELLAVSPDGWNNMVLYAQGSGGSDALITSSINSVEEVGDASAVPEPSSVLLFLPALGALAIVKRRRAGGSSVS